MPTRALPHGLICAGAVSLGCFWRFFVWRGASYGRWACTLAGAVKVVVVCLGASLEFFGLALVASPELAPWARRLGGAVRRAGQRLRARLMRLLRRRRHFVIAAEPGEYRMSGAGVSGEVTPGRDATLERKIDFLMEETKRTRRRLSELKREVAAHPDRWQRAIEAAKGDLASLMDEKVQAVRDEHIRRRLLGVVLLLFGVPVLAVANFL